MVKLYRNTRRMKSGYCGECRQGWSELQSSVVSFSDHGYYTAHLQQGFPATMHMEYQDLVTITEKPSYTAMKVYVATLSVYAWHPQT